MKGSLPFALNVNDSLPSHISFQYVFSSMVVESPGPLVFPDKESFELKELLP